MLYPWLLPHWEKQQMQMTAGRLHHALFITSASGMGKLSYAQTLAQTLLCKEPIGWEPCHQCHPCQLFETSVHPDYYLVSTESGKVIGVDQIRHISQKLNEYSQLAGNKVVIIEHAESFNLASANALLKTLEEPSNGSYIILLAENKSQVLPTIYSRCQKLHLPAPPEQETLLWLQQQFPIETPTLTAIRINHGAPLHTLSYLNNGDDGLRQEIFSNIALLTQQPAAITRLCEIITDRTLEKLSWLQFILLDLQKVNRGVGVDYIVNTDQLEWLTHFSTQLSQDKITQLQSELTELRQLLMQNNNLTAETLVLSFLIKLKRFIN
ncbi:HolB [Moritella viscosa]|uniref:DNA polymerase III subunit delta' n=2 Tax=Moritella viscosa TaxID=80854 RepID=A0A090ICX0_9GAMM|nr:DNA polymerase III subunit delta' [Moritella viscosa]SGZ06365.1 HolB [Moritella viscosa]SGZ06541.1 HolB [Moritella viscosa]SGZ13995.1 HolB [Moritella viscosa]SHO13707.1 HolB [Moritella viscosa]